MRPARRAIQVFSLSALDLFASAMGAFMIITLIIFPYYYKTSNAESMVDGLLHSHAEIRALVDDMEGEARSATEAADRMESEVPSPEEIAALEEEIARLESENEERLARLDALAEEYERGIPFSILGIETDANRIVVLIDMSGSMEVYSDLMIQTFERLLIPLNESVKLSVIGFQDIETTENLKFWPRRGQFAPMNARRKPEAIRFANSLRFQFNGGTPTFQALAAAVDMRPDTIFLLSDGEPTDLPSWSQIVESISIKNRSRARIHSIALGDYTYSIELIAFLRDLASQNGGSFLGVMR